MSKKKPNKYENVVADIQEAALSGNLDNMVSKELTYQQALSIYLRSRQLEREGSDKTSNISSEDLADQIQHCYKQREMRKDVAK